MNHYYRITAYNKTSNVCLIADSNGKFELFPLPKKKIFRPAIFRKRTPIRTTF